MAEATYSSIKIVIEADDKTGEGFKSAESKIKSFGKQTKTVSVSNAKLIKSLDKLNKTTQKTNGSLGKLTSSIGRIAFYRAIRSGIKAVTDAFKEGINNLYQWSSLANGKFMSSMDSISTSMLYFKNSLGAAVSPIINALAPAVDFLIDKFVALINVINQVFALISGASKWTKATKVQKKYMDTVAGGAGKAADEVKKLGLAQIDELTILDKSKANDSGGGAGDLDYGGMFEETDFDSKLKNLIDGKDWKGLGIELGTRINEMIDSVPWGKLGAKFGENFNAIITTLYWTLKTIDVVAIGRNIGTFINNAINNIDFQTFGRLLMRKFLMGIDFFIGALQGIDWKSIGKSIGDFVLGGLFEFNEWHSQIDWSKLQDDISFAIQDTLVNIEWTKIINAAFEALGRALGSLTGLLLATLRGFIWGIMEDCKGYIEELARRTGEDGIAGFLGGIWDAVKGIGKWIYDNVIDPFIKGWKEGLGIHSPSTVLEAIGKDTILGFYNGIKNKIDSLMKWVQDKVNKLKNIFNFEWKFPEIKLPHIPTPHFEMATGIMGIQYPKFTGWYAKGGFPETGSLFMANEAGPELVGSMNGRTAVANNDQIVAGIQRGVYEAMMSAMSSGTFNANVYLDGKQITDSVVRNVNNEARRTGISPLEVY